jgi:TPR repeat protein
MLLEGAGGDKDEVQALGWIKTAARGQDAEAMNMVGRCYENGWGATADSALAAAWYRKAAEAGDSWAQYNLGHMLLDGNGGPADPREAFFWYRTAGGRGHVRAMNLVGRCHEEGWGTPRDLDEAARWYRRSAEGGYFRGQFNWATILLSAGEPGEARTWFVKAAETGTTDARNAVADILSRSLSQPDPQLIPAPARISSGRAERQPNPDDRG